MRAKWPLVAIAMAINFNMAHAAPCPAGQQNVNGTCTQCTPGSYRSAAMVSANQALCKPHTVCDPTLSSGPLRGVNDGSGNHLKDTGCTYDNCTQLLAVHKQECRKSTNDRTTCLSTPVTTQRCIGIRRLYKQKPCSCVNPGLRI